MQIEGILWLESVADKIQVKHSVETWEVEEVFRAAPEFRRAGEGRRPGEDLYYALGQTSAGRYLFIVSIRKKGNRALVLTARDMTGREKEGYRRRTKHG